MHRRHVSDMERMESDLSQCRLEVQRLETERPQLSDRYHYFQVTRGYVHDLADCLTTKVHLSINLCAPVASCLLTFVLPSTTKWKLWKNAGLLS